MNFLNPWLWLGVGAVAFPVYLHLRRRDRQPVIPFGALRFLEDQPTARQAPLELRQILLFLLRLLAVLLLVAAFARPFQTPKDERATASTVYIFDNTFSRQADPRWDDDKRVVAAALRHAGRHQQVAVVELAGQARVLSGWGDSAPAAAATMEALPHTNQRGAFLAAFRLAESLLQQSLGEQKAVVFLTDNQQNQWEESASTVPFLAPGLVTLPRLPTEAARPNLSISKGRIQRFFAGDRCVMQFACEVRHEGLTTDPTVTLTVNGQELLRKELSLKGSPPRILISTQWEADPSEWIDGVVSADSTSDSLAADNRFYFTSAPLREGKVCLLSTSPFLQTALGPDVARGKWATRVLAPEALAAAVAEPAANDADVLVLDASYLPSTQARQLVARYLANGRGVFLHVDRQTTLIDGALRELSFVPKPEVPAASGEPLPLRFYASDSAVFAPFKETDLGNPLQVRLSKYASLSTPEMKSILFAANGDPVLFEGLRDQGRFLVAAFGFDRAHTDWVTHPTFLPFLDLALQSLRPQPILSTALDPGETWLATVSKQDRATRLHLSDDKHEIGATTLDANRRGQIRLPDQPGNYRVTYDHAPAVEQMVSVNPPADESDLRYDLKYPDTLRAWTTNPEKGNTAPASSAVQQGLSHTARRAAEEQPWWWYLALAAFALLLAESLATSTRRWSTASAA